MPDAEVAWRMATEAHSQALRRWCSAVSSTTGESGYGDPLTQPFWDAALEERLVIQRCGSCGTHQFYPRPFCLACSSEDVGWVQASGGGTIYSLTTVQRQILPTLPPPYVVALVELDKGPRILGWLVGDAPPEIGSAVRVAWTSRDGSSLARLQSG